MVPDTPVFEYTKLEKKFRNFIKKKIRNFCVFENSCVWRPVFVQKYTLTNFCLQFFISNLAQKFMF